LRRHEFPGYIKHQATDHLMHKFSRTGNPDPFPCLGVGRNDLGAAVRLKHNCEECFVAHGVTSAATAWRIAAASFLPSSGVGGGRLGAGFWTGAGCTSSFGAATPRATLAAWRRSLSAFRFGPGGVSAIPSSSIAISFMSLLR